MKRVSAIEESAPPRISIFTGDDSIGREKAKRAVVAAVCGAGGDVAEEHFDSTVEQFDEFTTRIITPSLFQNVRIFHIRHANRLSDGELAELGRVLRHELPDVYIIIEFDESLPKKAKVGRYLDTLGVKELSKKGQPHLTVFEFLKPPDYKIPEWLTRQVPRLFSRTMTREDAELLVEYVGAELDVLYSELQKIDIHLPPRAPVDRAAIESISGAMRAQTPFELARALGNRNFALALDIIDSLFASTFYGPACLAIIFRHFWGLFRVRTYAKTNPETMTRYLSGGRAYQAQNAVAHEIGVATGLLARDDPAKKAYPVIILSRVVEQARSFSDEQLEKVFRWLREFDVGIKTGRADASKHAFQLLCYKIVRIGEYRLLEAP